MLKALRQKQRAKKIILGIIIGIMVLAFVFWGAGAYKQSAKESNYAGVIFARKVSNAEFKKIRSSCLNDLRLRFGEAYNQLLPFVNLDNQAWIKLILLEQAKKLRLSVSNQEVVQEVTSNPLFAKDGKFNQNIYERIVRYFLNTQPRDFEEQTRANLIIRKLYVQATQELAVSDEEVLNAYKKEFETLSINYVEVNPKDFLPAIKVNDEELKDYYQKNSSQFKRPPTVSIEYIGTDFPLGAAEEIDKIKIFDNVKYSYPNIKASRELKDAAQGNISYHKTGFFALNETVDGIVSEEFYKTCFGLKEGGLSPVIQTEKGVYVLRVLKKKDSYIPTLEEIKAKAEEALKLEKAEAQAKKKIEEYKNKIEEARKNDSTINLKKAGELLGVEVKTSPAYKRNQPLADLTLSQEIRNRAFELKPNQISDSLNGASVYYLIEQDKFTPIDEAKFKQEKETYAKNLLEEKKKDAFNKLQGKLISQASIQKYSTAQDTPE